jgi:AcrR family transcriptional regulator
MITAILTRKERQERTRELLVAAASRVFARRGYHQATVEEIAAEAGFSTGAVYSNFSGKEELFLSLADLQVSERVAESRRSPTRPSARTTRGPRPPLSSGPSSSATRTGRSCSTSSGR